MAFKRATKPALSFFPQPWLAECRAGLQVVTIAIPSLLRKAPLVKHLQLQTNSDRHNDNMMLMLVVVAIFTFLSAHHAPPSELGVT